MKTDSGLSPMMPRYQASTSCGALCPCQAGDKCYIFNLGPARLSRDGRAATGCEAFAPSCCPQRPCCRKRALQSLCSTERGLHDMGQVHISCVQAALCLVATHVGITAAEQSLFATGSPKTRAPRAASTPVTSSHFNQSTAGVIWFQQLSLGEDFLAGVTLWLRPHAGHQQARAALSRWSSRAVGTCFQDLPGVFSPCHIVPMFGYPKCSQQDNSKETSPVLCSLSSEQQRSFARNRWHSQVCRLSFSSAFLCNLSSCCPAEAPQTPGSTVAR